MRNYCLIFSLLMITLLGKSQPNWELQKEEDGIKVFTAAIEGSDIKAFKVAARMEGKLSSFVAVLKDIDSYPELFSSNMFAQVMEQNDTFQVQYSQTKVPWPITDRDGVYVNTFSQHYGHKTVTVTVDSKVGAWPEQDGFVRMEEATGYWEFHPIDHNAVEVTYQMHAEPGGNLPPWVINMFLVDSPIKDMKNFQERVKLDKYANQKFDFLVDY